MLLIPYLSTYQAISNIGVTDNSFTFIPVIVISTINIVFFYLHLYWLIPRFLFQKSYVKYVLLILLTVLVEMLFAFMVFQLTGVDPERYEQMNPIIHKIRPIANANAFLMLMISYIASLSLAVGNRLKKIEREKVKTQLSVLRNQINPHFLFNNLNSIYATVLDVSPKAAEMIEKLSEMMRYTMIDSAKDLVKLREEVIYVQNFIDLQKLRLDSTVKVKETYDEHVVITEHLIAPMLLIPFIENAFKHGVNPDAASEISISMLLEKDTFYLHVENLKVAKSNGTMLSGGVGLANTQQRLELIYTNNYELRVDDNEERYAVFLKIELA